MLISPSRNAVFIVRNTCIPELIVDLALRDHVQIRALDISWKRKRRCQLICRLQQKCGLIDSALSVRLRQRQNRVGTEFIVSFVILWRRVKLQLRTPRDNTRIGAVHDIAQNDVPCLGAAEQRGIVRLVTLHVPCWRQVASWFWRCAEIDVHVSQIDDRRAVELSPGRHVKVCRKHDLLPWARAACGRRELETLDIEVYKLGACKQLNHTRSFVRTRYREGRRLPYWTNRLLVRDFGRRHSARLKVSKPRRAPQRLHGSSAGSDTDSCPAPSYRIAIRSKTYRD